MGLPPRYNYERHTILWGASSSRLECRLGESRGNPSATVGVRPLARPDGFNPSCAEKIEKPSPANFGIALPAGKTSSGTTGAPVSNVIIRRFVSEFQPALMTTSGDVPNDVDLKDLNKLRETLIA